MFFYLLVFLPCLRLLSWLPSALDLPFSVFLGGEYVSDVMQRLAQLLYRESRSLARWRG